MAALPKQMRFSVSHADGSPAADCMVSVCFETHMKNDYGFLFGPTGPDGTLVVPEADVVKRANAEIDDAPMDYHPIEAAFTGYIRASAAGIDILERALEAYAMYGRRAYPRGYGAALKKALETVRRLGRPTLVAEADGCEIAIDES